MTVRHTPEPDARAASDPDGDALTFSWTFGDNKTGTGALVHHTYTAVGTYEVRVSVQDTHNASANFLRTVRVSNEAGNQAPVVAIATGPRSGAAPLILDFDGTNSFDPDGDSLSFSWAVKRDGVQVGDALIGPLVSFTFTAEGTYTLELAVTDSRGAKTTSTPEVIEVFSAEPPPGQDVGNGNDNTGNDNQDSAAQRPLCGLGMLPAIAGIFLGMSLLSVSRRKPT